MLVRGEFKFMGAEARPGFNDPSKVNYVVGLAQGLDNIRIYVNDPVLYGTLVNYRPYGDVLVELDYNPVAKDVKYCMRLVSIREKPVAK